MAKEKQSGTGTLRDASLLRATHRETETRLDDRADRFQVVKGRLAALRGDTAAAEAGYKPAAGLFRELEMPFWLAVTQTEHGELLREAGRAAEAEPLLAEAREIFERLEATVWLERLGATEPAAEPAVI